MAPNFDVTANRGSSRNVHACLVQGTPVDPRDRFAALHHLGARSRDRAVQGGRGRLVSVAERAAAGGVRGAFLWMFIWSLLGKLKLRNLSFLGSDQMDNLLRRKIQSSRGGGISARLANHAPCC